MPWASERQNEINVIFHWKNNQIRVEGSLDGRPGEFIVGSAQPRSVLDTEFAPSAPLSPKLLLGNHYSVSLSPVTQNLGGIADGILGADAWVGSTLAIDYARQLVIISTEPADSMDGPVHSFEGPPSVPITIDGQPQRAIVDLALPDTLILPAEGQKNRRRRGHVRIGSHDLGSVDMGTGNTTEVRIGNRLLSQFLIKIDYRRQTVSLWRDPRRA